MTVRELIWFREADQHCDWYGTLCFATAEDVERELRRVRDPFLRWAAELGVREGRWLREKAQGAAA